MDLIHVDISTDLDFDGWVRLAREMEPLFGPMAEEPKFRESLEQAISEKTAFCVPEQTDTPDRQLAGGVVVSLPANEIIWLAVSCTHRNRGYGAALLRFAIDRLDSERPIDVQTFDPSVPEGVAARSLYLGVGFHDHRDGGNNPAGLPTVMMRRPADP